MEISKDVADSKIKLNLGCGKKVLDGYINIDIVSSPKAAREPEILCDLRKLTLEDDYADEAIAIHVIEHFYVWEVCDVLIEWRRVLKPGGLLVIECPDILKSARNLLDRTPPQESIWGIYGDPLECNEYMSHKWGWTPETLTLYLQQAGFGKIREADPQWHGKRKLRDMRLEAIKT